MTSIRNVRITVRDWDGTYRHERYLEHIDAQLRMNVPSSGWEASRAGNGDCLELTWRGLSDTLGVQERDLVELDVLDTTGPWRREWAGVAVKSGNSLVRNAHTNYKAAGLRKRCSEVRVPVNLGEDDIGAQFRAAVQAVLDSGQLGESIILDPALVPDTGVLLGRVQSWGARLSDVCDYLAGQAGRTWGVNADRKIFLTDDSSTLSLVEGQDTVATFEDTDSEALVTRVQFTLGRWDHPRDAGTLMNYDVTLPEAAAYGVAVKDVLFDSPSAVRLAGFTVGAVNLAETDFSSLTDGREDGDPTAPYVAMTSGGGSDYPSVTMTLTEPALRVRLSLRIPEMPGTTTPRTVSIQMLVPGEDFSQDFAVFSNGAAADVLTAWLHATRTQLMPAGTTIQVQDVGSAPSGARLVELRPEAPNLPVLEALADFHAVSPQRDPATITVWGSVTPHPKLSLVRLSGEVYENPVEALTLHIKLGSSLRTEIRAGQREAAEVRAQRWLRSVEVQAAVTDAVRFGA